MIMFLPVLVSASTSISRLGLSLFGRAISSLFLGVRANAKFSLDMKPTFDLTSDVHKRPFDPQDQRRFAERYFAFARATGQIPVDTGRFISAMRPGAVGNYYSFGSSEIVLGFSEEPYNRTISFADLAEQLMATHDILPLPNDVVYEQTFRDLDQSINRRGVAYGGVA